MPLPNITFNLGSGNLGRPLPGFDHYSILIAYDYGTSATAGYSAMAGELTSIEDAESLGIVDTCAEATAATSIQLVTNVGTDGDTVAMYFEDWNGESIYLGTYTKVTADTTVTLVAAGCFAAINARTYIHGFTAAAGTAGQFVVTAPKSYGTWPNSKSQTNTITGTIAITNNAYSGGTKSQLALYHYQIKEFFRMNPLGILYFAIKFDDSAQSATLYNAQLQTDGLAIQNTFKGQARQIGFYNPQRTFATSTLTALKALRTTLLGQYTPAEVLYWGAYSGTLAAQANARDLSADGVGPVLGQSGSGLGFELSQTQLQKVGGLGCALGTLSAAAVSQSIGEVQAFNLSDGSEMEVAEFFDGTNYDTISTSLQNQLHDYGYIFPRTYPNVTGTFWNAGNAAVSPSSDYAYIEDSRTIDKAIRDVYASIVKLLNSKNRVNSDGTLAEASIAAYNEKIDVALDAMVRDEDLSAFTRNVSRTEVVATTGTIPITIGLQQTPISRMITITIGFTATV